MILMFLYMFLTFTQLQNMILMHFELMMDVMHCKTRENSIFFKNGKMVISVKIQNFSRSQMTKRTSPLESSHEI